MDLHKEIFDATLYVGEAIGKAAINGASKFGKHVVDDIESEKFIRNHPAELYYVSKFEDYRERSFFLGDKIYCGFVLLDKTGKVVMKARQEPKNKDVMILKDRFKQEIGFIDRSSERNLVIINGGRSVDLSTPKKCEFEDHEVASSGLQIDSGRLGVSILNAGRIVSRIETQRGGPSFCIAQLRLLDASYLYFTFGVYIAKQSWSYCRGSGGSGDGGDGDEEGGE